MLKFEVLKAKGKQSLTLYTNSQTIPTDFTCCEVRLLRRKSFKNNFFTPVVTTNHVLLLFPNSCAKGIHGNSSSSNAAAASPAQRCDSLSVGNSSTEAYVTCQAQACISHFLTRIEFIPFRISYAAACTFSGCALLVLECTDMEDVLSVQQICAGVTGQGNDERTSSLYVKSFTCDSGTPVSFDSQLATTHYYIPTCPLCGDRLESTVSGYPSQTPLCTCSREGNTNQCTCFLSSACFVCRRFAESLEQTRQPQGTQQSSQESQKLQAPAIKCEACAKAGDPWICLICGYVGCSRYQAMHAKDHCVAHQHFFSMNLLTQQIWDYDGDCFVHRVVFLLDTHTGSSTRMQFPGREDPLLVEGNRGGDDNSVSLVNGLDTPDAWKAEKKSISAKYDKKLISSHTQYAMVIKSELDAKRALYEARLIEEGGGTEGGAGAVDDDEGGSSRGEPYTNEEFEREAYFDLAKAFEPVDSVVADVVARRRKVTAMFYGVRNLEHEVDMRAEETGRLEKRLEGLKKNLRNVIQKNVASDLRLSSSIHDLKETLKDIALNTQTQRRLAARLGDSQVARIVVTGGRDASSRGTTASTSAATSGNHKKPGKTNSKNAKK